MQNLKNFYSDSDFCLLKVKLRNQDVYHYGKIVVLGGVTRPTPKPEIDGLYGTFRKIKHLRNYLRDPNNTENFEEFGIHVTNIESIKIMNENMNFKEGFKWDFPLLIKYNNKDYQIEVATSPEGDDGYFIFLNNHIDCKNNLLPESLELEYNISKNIFGTVRPPTIDPNRYKSISPEIISCIISHICRYKVHWLSDFWPIDDIT